MVNRSQVIGGIAGMLFAALLGYALSELAGSSLPFLGGIASGGGIFVYWLISRRKPPQKK